MSRTTKSLHNHCVSILLGLFFCMIAIGSLPERAQCQEELPGGMGGPGTPASPGLGGGTGGGSNAVGGSGVQSGMPGTGPGSAAGDPGNGAPVPVCRTASFVDGDLEDMTVMGDCPCNGSGTGAATFSASGASGGSSGSSCSSCGGGSSNVLGLDPDFSAGDVNRVWIPNNRVNNSSFSPGYYSQFDSQLNIYPETTGSTIVFFDVFGKSTYQFVDGLDGDPLDGVYHDLINNHSREIRLVNANGANVTTVSQATNALVQHWNGTRESFAVIDLDPTATAALAGRLTSRVNREGRGVTINYKQFTAQELAASPDRQWQINTVTDSESNSLSFTYDATQRSGRWVVSGIQRQDNSTVGFTYNSANLTAVTFPDGTKSTFEYGQNATAQTATVTVYEAAKSKRKQTYHFTNDYMSLSTSRQQQVINQPTGILRMIENDADEVTWMRVPAADPAVDREFFYIGGNQAIVTSLATSSFQEVLFWNVTLGEVTAFAGIIDLELSQTVVGPGYSTSLSQVNNGQFPSIVDQEGRQKQYQYDVSGNVTRITYPADQSFEEFSYNILGQKVRERSRTGEVVLHNYDAQGRKLSTQSGLQEQGGQDVQTASYAISSKEYYPTGHVNAGLMKSERDSLYNSAQPTLHSTDYEYTTQGRVSKKIGPAASAGEPRPETSYIYDAAGRLSEVTDPLNRATTYVYDTQGRLISLVYPDASTEQTLYSSSTATSPGRILKTKDRVGTVTSYSYDAAGRLAGTVVGAARDGNILEGAADDTTITDPNEQTITQYDYLDGSTLKSQIVVNGAATQTVFDYLNRVVEVTQNPRVGKTLTSTKTYLNNELLCDTDPYGRKKYYGYRASDGTLIRTVTCTVPSFTLADFTAVWNLTRSSTANALYIVHDAIRDNDGHLVQIIDGRGTETRFEYDAQGRETKKTEAWGTSIAAVTETVYNAVGNVTEVRTPRYFDSTDTEGYQKAKETWTYNGRGEVATHTEASGSAIAATESFTYDLAGHQETHTDFAGKVWSTIDDTCCGKSTASKNPLGHGSIRNTDPAGRVVHTASVADVQDHVTNMGSPVDAKTLSESTTLFDSLGRTKASTTWLVALGAVDPVSPPIAGLNSVPSANGLTTQYLYDNNLTDGVGLDSSTGLSFTKMAAAGSSSVSLSAAITKLAAAESSGGAGITFSSTAPGRASVVINAQDEVSFSISDAAGRTVMSGQLDNYTGTANNLLTWSCQLHDTVTTVAGYGDCLESRSIDALGKVTKSLTDGGGRTIQSIDQLSKVTNFTYDAGGNQLSVRDPNNVGQDVVYDALGRAGLTTDTAGATTNSTYDKAGNRIAAIDGKTQSTTYVFDARGRQKSQKDRNNGTTAFAYFAAGQLQSLSDAEGQTTSYTYDDAGGKVTEQYPDHTGGTPGQSTYGIVTFTNDAAGRVLRKQDQKGDTCTMNYDLAGRLTSKNYRTLANSPSGTIADTDAFTYDKAGRMLSAISGRYVNTVTYDYDSAGRKKTEALTISGQTYTTTTGYNTKGELTSYTYPDGTAVGRSYSARGELYQLTHAGTTIDTRVYDNGGRMTSSTFNNGVSETRAYGTDNTLSSINFSGASIGNLTYGWDANKNKTSEAIAGTMSNYGFTVPTNGYDSEDRLVGFNRTSGLTQSWNLSPVGDWNSVTTNGSTETRTHGPTHELLTAGGQNVSTDTKGNITLIPAALRPNSASLLSNWDFDNRLNTADVGNNGSIDVTYKFDAMGRRVFRDDGTTATIYVQAGQQTIADYTAGTAAASPTYRYVYASYIDEPVLRYKPSTSESLYYHRNQQYSVVALTNSSAAIVERYAYSAYGVPTITNASGTVLPVGSVDNRYLYTGREWDSVLAQYHYRARIYDANLGRFVSRDPIGYRGGSNFFSYVAGRVLNAVDPTGLKLIEVQFNAFISNLHDADGDGWITEAPPWLNFFGYYVNTNKRWAGQTGSSKIALTVSIDSCDIGKQPPSRTSSSSGSIRGIEKSPGNIVPHMTSTVSVSANDGVGLRNPCESYWKGDLEATYPFLPSPSIRMGGEIKFVAGKDTVDVFFDLHHTHFPDFEVIVNAGGKRQLLRSNYSIYSHPAYGLPWWSSKKTQGAVKISAITKACCGGTCT